MDLSNCITNRKEMLLLDIAKSLQQVEENTHSKAQETLEFKMNTSQKKFSI